MKINANPYNYFISVNEKNNKNGRKSELPKLTEN
jgi:hypothetical protein